MECPSDPLALVGDRRIGKTSHLLFELVPLAQKRGLVPVYIDVFQHRSDPLAAINYTLQEAIDDIAVPRSQTGKRLKTAVKKFGVGSMSLELGEEPARRRPDDPFLLVDWLLKTLVRAAKRPVPLVFDEVQELATAGDSENVVSAIRSAITKSKNSIRVVFTGSSQQKLLELFSRSRAALYEGASTMPFPHSGEDFIDFVAWHCRERFKKRVGVGELSQAFARLHHQPRALIDLALVFASRSADNLAATLDDQIRAQLTGAEYGALWSSMRQLQQRICLRIVRGEDVTSIATGREYAQGSKRHEIPPGIR
jgi:uncharacterized protein